jgi:CelD/BcsL family acetyltransferase involved in cellulose biosynthesis
LELNLQIIRDRSELRSAVSFADNVTFDSRMSPMQDPAWSLSAAETLLGRESLMAAAIVDGGRLLALAVLSRGMGLFRGYRQVGHKELGEPGDFYYVDQASLNSLIEALYELQVPIALDRTWSDSKAVDQLVSAYRGRGIVTINDAGSCPYIDLETCNGDSDQLLSRSLHSDLRRSRRKAETLGAVTFEVHAPVSEQEFLPLYEQAMRVEAASWKGRSGTALAVAQEQRNFFRVYGRRMAERGALRMAFLRIGPKVVAMQYTVQTNERIWALKIGYDEQFRRCSPGILLMQSMLRYAAECGLRSYEFLGSPAPWINRWTALERSTIRVDLCHSKARYGMMRANRTKNRLFSKLRESRAESLG